MQETVGTWADATFIHSTNQTIVAHLAREVAELAEAVGYDSKFAIGDEAADCLLLLLHLCHRNGIDLGAEAELVYERNLSRMWAAPDGEGVSEHVAARGRR